MSKSRYTPKVGDSVRIIKNTCRHGFRIGDIVTVDSEPSDAGAIVAAGGGDWWAVERSDFVLHKKPTAPKPTKEPKMPEPKETKSPLYTAVRDILEAKDRETLDARTKKAVEAVDSLLAFDFPCGGPK